MSEIIHTSYATKGGGFPAPVVVKPAEINVSRAGRHCCRESGRRQLIAAVSAASSAPADASRFISSSPPMNFELMKTCGTVVRPGVFLEQLLDGAITRLTDHVQLGDVHAQTIDLTKHPQRVLGIGSVALREDDGRVAERELRLD